LEPNTVRIEKLVHGGQGLGTVADGRKVFVWNALPDELVRFRVTRKKKSFVEGIAEEILEASKERTEPIEANYLATSPWQIMRSTVENGYKLAITRELMQQARVDISPQTDIVLADQPSLEHTEACYGYRNKMEYSFWGDGDGLHLALHNRGSHQKQIVQGSKLAMPALDVVAQKIITELNNRGIRAGDLKTIIVRCDQRGNAVAALFVKNEDFSALELPDGVQGLRVYFSNPKSPASVPTKLIQELGDATLHDTLLGRQFTYDVDSFFQVNVPVFEYALSQISAAATGDKITDVYAGTGSIGLSVAERQVDLVELDAASAGMARINAAASRLETQVIEAPAESDPMTYITGEGTHIFDPPRAGLHQKVVDAVLAAKPPKIIYLSCNPATQARDLALLQEGYKIESISVYNFFPRTPHIESLAVLRRK
jgi:23S rRNA (uracil1939-C5)-methyltransferase